MPPPIVHVIDPAGPLSASAGLLSAGAAADIAVIACARAVRATAERRHTVLLLGTRATAEHARGLGLAESDAPVLPVSAPLGHGGLAWRGLRQALATLPEDAVLQPWSARASLACRLAAAGKRPVAPVPGALWPAFGERLGESGEACRAALGVPADVPLVALLCDPFRHADTRRFVYMVGALRVAGYPVAGLMDRRSAHLARARRFHAESGVAWRMLIADEPLGRMLQACDAALVLPPSVHAPLRADEAAWVRWSVARAHEIGVPVVGAADRLPREMLPAEEGSLAEVIAPWPGSFRELVRRLILLSDRDGVHQLALSVTAAAGAFASVERFASGLERAWSGTEFGPALSRDAAQTPA